eukprot:TRINITY_DN518_c0_g1_i1.p1 TRINITY_DN518_c0_g1~~TRINITY_DN518_c0_g1_i1.p1  ORF type:complete len:311 (+),score=46.71 TRINITY_DN518_c0_g1_i1:92-1024(+)
MIRRPPRSTLSSSSAASDVYKRQVSTQSTGSRNEVMLRVWAAVLTVAVGSHRALRANSPVLKRIFFVRHGHAEHNDATEKALAQGLPFGESVMAGAVIRDPVLTAKGEGQARALTQDLILQRALVEGLSRAETVVVSPCTRTLQTAWLGLAEAAEGLQFVAQEECQECADVPSDTGRPVSEISPEFPAIDFSGVADPDHWFRKVGPWDFLQGSVKPAGLQALKERCVRFTAWLAARPEQCMIVVTHHTFLAHLLELEFSNCEVMELGLRADGSWTVLDARATPAPLLKDGQPLTFCGSPPLRGTAKGAQY